MILRLFVYLCAFVVIVFIGIILFRNAKQTETPVLFSPSQMLTVTWQKYVNAYLEKGTFRVMDRDRNDVTTSEGESYAMLRGVWMNDKPVFDESWQWIQDNLQRPDDHLFSWKWGKT